MKDKRVYLIDATAFCYRAFYALPMLATTFGQPTNAVYGFVNILNKILKERKPEFLAVCFDVSRETFRTKKFAEYKIHRPPMPDTLSSQIPIIKEIVKAYGISVYEKEGFEADDIIATLTTKAGQEGFKVTIVSSDKDILQLVDDNTIVFSPYKDEGVTYDENKVIERYGVKPNAIADIIALMGDDVDNIPGVAGVGEKTAASLVNDFGSLEKLLGSTDKIKQEKLRNLIAQNLDKINLSRELADLDRDVDIDFDLERLKIAEPDYQELFKLFKFLEFKKLLKDLPLEETSSDKIKVNEIYDKELPDSLESGEELVFYATAADEIVFLAKNKIFKTATRGSNVKKILEDGRINKTSHDLKTLKILLAENNLTLNGLYFDTMIAAYLLNPSKAEYNLSDIAFDYLGEATAKEMVAEKALHIIARLRPILEKELREKSLFKLFKDLEMPLVAVLSSMELAGIKIDVGLLKKLSLDIEKRLIKLIGDIYELSGTQFNINSPKQLREILFEKLKLPVVRRSKTGPSTDEEVLKVLADKHKLPALLLEYRHLTKLKNTYIDTLPDLMDKKTGRIHTSFNQTGTETGRLSSSNPNLQNIPIKTDIGRNIRKAIIASGADYYLLSCDYSQIELRILAHLSRDENLIKEFKNDKDIHKATAALTYGVEEKDVSDEMRETAKRVNFGIVYGLTSYGLSRDLGISVDEAQRFIEAYFARYPRVQDYIQKQIEACEEQGFVTTILGRRRYIPQIANKNQAIRQFARRQAINTPIQGSASDLIKLAMVHIHREMAEKKMRSRMLLQIHDELVFDVPNLELNEMTKLARNRMENVLQLDVPVKVEIRKGRNWLEMKEVE
jgi:DNA polymerase-1